MLIVNSEQIIQHFYAFLKSIFNKPFCKKKKKKIRLRLNQVPRTYTQLQQYLVSLLLAQFTGFTPAPQPQNFHCCCTVSIDRGTFRVAPIKNDCKNCTILIENNYVFWNAKRACLVHMFILACIIYFECLFKYLVIFFLQSNTHFLFLNY